MEADLVLRCDFGGSVVDVEDPSVVLAVIAIVPELCLDGMTFLTS